MIHIRRLRWRNANANVVLGGGSCEEECRRRCRRRERYGEYGQGEHGGGCYRWCYDARYSQPTTIGMNVTVFLHHGGLQIILSRCRQRSYYERTHDMCGPHGQVVLFLQYADDRRRTTTTRYYRQGSDIVCQRVKHAIIVDSVRHLYQSIRQEWRRQAGSCFWRERQFGEESSLGRAKFKL